jgi:hypothetical protein
MSVRTIEIPTITEPFRNNAPKDRITFLQIGKFNEVSFIYDQSVNQVAIENKGGVPVQLIFHGTTHNGSIRCPTIQGTSVYIEPQQMGWFGDDNGVFNSDYNVSLVGQWMTLADISLVFDYPLYGQDNDIWIYGFDMSNVRLGDIRTNMVRMAGNYDLISPHLKEI